MKRLKLAALFVFGLSILFYFFFDYSKHALGIGVSNPFAEDPYDAVGSFGIQLTLLAALLMLVRTFRPYPQEGAAPGQFLPALRCGAVVLLSVTVTLVADAIGLVRSIVTDGASPVAWMLAGLVGGMAIVTLAAGWTFVRAARSAEVPSATRPWGWAVVISGLAILILAFYPMGWRNSGVPGGVFTALTGMVLLFVTVWLLATIIFPVAEFAYEDIFDDLVAIYAWLRTRLRFAAGLFTWLDKIAALPPVCKSFGWLNPRKHRWNLVVLVAVILGVSLVLVEALAEGLSPNLGRVLLVFGVYIGIEGAGVALGYVLLRRFLGIFRQE